MWANLGLAFVVLAAVHSGSYALWLWEQKERPAALGVALLIALSVALPFFAALRGDT